MFQLLKTPIVVEELVDDVLVKFRKMYPGQSIETEIPEDFISIPMDALLIEQVIINLLENAVLHAYGMTTLFSEFIRLTVVRFLRYLTTGAAYLKKN